MSIFIVAIRTCVFYVTISHVTVACIAAMIDPIQKPAFACLTILCCHPHVSSPNLEGICT